MLRPSNFWGFADQTNQRHFRDCLCITIGYQSHWKGIVAYTGRTGGIFTQAPCAHRGTPGRKLSDGRFRFRKMTCERKEISSLPVSGYLTIILLINSIFFPSRCKKSFISRSSIPRKTQGKYLISNLFKSLLKPLKSDRLFLFPSRPLAPRASGKFQFLPATPERVFPPGPK